MTRIPVQQGSDEWKAVRRTKVTASDIPILLGLSPFKSEATLAAEKLDGTEQASTLPMRIGLAMEPLIASEYEAATGRTLRRFHGLIQHPQLDWAAASPDWSVVGERMLVEGKWTASRSRFADGLPQDVEAQVIWQMGVAGYSLADVAVLAGELLRFPVVFDADLFAHMVTVAADFRRRLEEGGPFAHDAASLKAAYPADNGAEMVADAEINEAVRALIALRGQRKDMEAAEERIETAVKARMGEAAALRGDGYRVTWKQTKPVEQVDWKSIADGLLRTMPETEARALVGIGTTVRQGFRPFRVTLDKE